MPSSAGCGGVVAVSGSILLSSTSWPVNRLGHMVLMLMPGIRPLTIVATIARMPSMVATMKVTTAISQCPATRDQDTLQWVKTEQATRDVAR